MTDSKRPPHKTRLSAEAWAHAALDALAAGGLPAVAVEPIARRLQVTKGSFYWHFESRDALIRAALGAWERRAVEAVRTLSEIADPGERLRALMLTAPDRSRVRLDLAVSLAADDARVRPFARRVDRLWLDWAETAYREMGFSSLEARQWGLSAYSAYVGLIHLVRLQPQILKGQRSWVRYTRHLAGMLVP